MAMFDPTVGRWLQSDPKGFDAGDHNLYRYVKNSPTSATDPSGLAADPPPFGQKEKPITKSYPDKTDAAAIANNLKFNFKLNQPTPALTPYKVSVATNSGLKIDGTLRVWTGVDSYTQALLQSKGGVLFEYEGTGLHFPRFHTSA
jgi:uncharacterized protein RhaS with RHS repeats